VGKGARNRARRDAEKAEAAIEDAVRDAVAQLVVLETFDEYATVANRPELDSSRAAAVLEEFAQTPAYGAMAARAVPLLLGAQNDDLQRAWSEHGDLVAAIQPQIDRLEQLDKEATDATNRHDHALAIERLGEALQIADEVGLGARAFDFLQRIGVSWLDLQSPNRPAEVEAAIAAFAGALEIAAPGDMAAHGLLRLSTALGERVFGDRADNLADAVEMLRLALQEAATSDDMALRSTIEVNLSVALGRSEGGDRLAMAQEAVALCRAALEVRSPEADVDDWTYAQINFGAALDSLAAAGGGDRSEAHAALTAVLDHRERIADRSLIGVTHHLLGRVEVAQTDRRIQELVEEHDAAGALEDRDYTPELRSARAHYERAVELTTADPIRRGRALQELGDVLGRLGETDRAIEVLEEALTVLLPSTAPDACQSAAWRLAGVFSDRGDWDQAAVQWRVAVEASEIALHSRMDSASREREASQAGNLYRWAADAIARTGQVEEAATILDAGRGRELARRLRDDSVVDGIPSELQQRYRTAVVALRSSPLVGDDSTAASRQLQEVISEIRALPEHAAFATTPAWEEVAAGAQQDFPLVYINPAPTGTMILAVVADGDGGTSASVRFVDVTSDDVFMTLAAGTVSESAGSSDGRTGNSYLVAAAGQVNDDDLIRRALDDILPWLGEGLTRHVDEVLRSAGATGVTLIPCGPLGLAPLHAACWRDATGTKVRLVDRYVIRYAPSGRVAAAARRRATTVRTDGLVALGNPDGSLPAAVPEVMEIGAHFGVAARHIATGSDANEAFLAQHGPTASHIHLACHARADILDSSDAAIELASGDLLATELPKVAGFETRLVVASACQSAIPAMARMQEEPVSIATAILAAGGHDHGFLLTSDHRNSPPGSVVS
jgi:tetratricopeptide (TPR) repeat protein